MKRTIVTIVVALVAVFAMTSAAQAAKGAKQGKALRGKIISVSADGTSMVIQTGGHKKNANAANPGAAASTPQQVTVTFAAGVVVTINGTPGTVQQLAAGDRVSVSPAAGAATEVKAKTGGVKGKNKKAA